MHPVAGFKFPIAGPEVRRRAEAPHRDADRRSRQSPAAPDRRELTSPVHEPDHDVRLRLLLVPVA